MLFLFKADVPFDQLHFVVVGYRPKVRHKNIIALLLRKESRAHAALARTQNSKASPPSPLKGELLIVWSGSFSNARPRIALR
jgi:hypothetical protein